MARQLSLVLYGLGAIGRDLGRFAVGKGLRLAGAIDVDPAIVGRDLGEVLGLKPLGVRVGDDADAVLAEAAGDVVAHCTTSRLWEAHPQIAKAALHGYDVVSTCEELAYPWRDHRHLALELHQAAQRAGVTVLGTGVNPGFVHDALVLALSSMCKRVERIAALRVVDARRRRGPLQRKVGAGLSVEDFRAAAREARIGHVGTYESIDMIAETIGWNLRDVKVEIEPVVAKAPIATEHVAVAPGQVAGIRQVGRGYVGDREVITLDLRMYLGAEDPRDEILIEGVPGVDVVIRRGIAGDDATVAAVVNAIPHVVAAPPGLKTMRDLPLPTYVAEVLGPDA